MATKAKKPNKISKEELEVLTALQQEVNNVLGKIGNAEIVKSQLISKHAEIQKKWNENANVLEAAYGKVNIDLSSGEIKEIEAQEE
mgnify:CR=1 FL=1